MLLALLSTFVGPLLTPATGVITSAGTLTNAAVPVLHATSGVITSAAVTLAPAAVADPHAALWLAAAALLGASCGFLWPFFENRQPGEPFDVKAAAGALFGGGAVFVAVLSGAASHAGAGPLLDQLYTVAAWAFALATVGQKVQTAAARSLATAALKALAKVTGPAAPLAAAAGPLVEHEALKLGKFAGKETDKLEKFLGGHTGHSAPPAPAAPPASTPTVTASFAVVAPVVPVTADDDTTVS